MKRRTAMVLAGSAVAGAAGLALGACSGPAVGDYAAAGPALDLRTYLSGRLTAHGMFSDRSGRVVRRFAVQLTGTWDGDDGTLDERFVYDDGEKQTRVWRLKHLGGGRYRGLADDVVGEALGSTSGPAFHWQYTLRLPYDGRVIDVQLDDWMFLIDDRVMLNRATVSKFGVRVGDIQLAFDKPR